MTEENPFMRFHSGQYQFKVPCVKYVDFEAILEKPLQGLEEEIKEEIELYHNPIPEAPYTGTATKPINCHVPSRFCIYSICAYGAVEDPWKLYRSGKVRECKMKTYHVKMVIGEAMFTVPESAFTYLCNDFHSSRHWGMPPINRVRRPLTTSKSMQAGYCSVLQLSPGREGYRTYSSISYAIVVIEACHKNQNGDQDGHCSPGPSELLTLPSAGQGFQAVPGTMHCIKSNTVGKINRIKIVN